MAFDTTTRNRLNKFVAEARRVLTEEFSEQLQSLYGISASGGIAPLERLTHLDAEGLELAATLRQRIAYLTSSSAAAGEATKPAIDRLTREQAFTVLNRLAAIRMAEKRGLIVESVGQQYQSQGFKVFESVAGSAIGEMYDRYRCYLFCLFDELAIDLGSLFDRRSPQALLFPRETSLLALLNLLDEPDLQDLWAEDETIGWIYQYYNDPAERKKMREESAAPRNSRELAVRNQFFTPRYVVEFLTDNTLGRIWYEMTQGATALKEQCRYLVRRPTEIFLKPGETAPEQPTQDGLSQEDLLKQPVFIAHRPLKDPRSVLMLDPACGSMHFGLYAFDLFEAIYDEAWEIATGSDAAAKSGEAFAPFCTFAASFADKAALQREVPRMIVEHNLHGIDIDPRAAQIAGLSLWLRAQRAWHAAGVKPVDRPRITRSNIVCAEPMPGDKVLLAEFVEQQFPEGERAAFGFLLETVFDRMTLAGEAGSLLKIEEEIRTAIAEAKKIWEKEPAFNQRMLFGGENAAEVTQKKLDLSGITDEQFWEGAEERIYDALRDYAEQAETGGFQRRLFAEDAARGFAFIDVCRKRYDVANLPLRAKHTFSASSQSQNMILLRHLPNVLLIVSPVRESLVP
ncbi:MAG: SAM-dependent methyltransferase [Acidobacteria bacterium]|nr:SAM-dependent methyltransferase [Acidobacteriota bacterium]